MNGNDPGALVQISRVSFDSNSHGLKANWTRCIWQGFYDQKEKHPKGMCYLFHFASQLRFWNLKGDLPTNQIIFLHSHSRATIASAHGNPNNPTEHYGKLPWWHYKVVQETKKWKKRNKSCLFPLKTAKWRRRVSIPVPLACKASALPFELHPLTWWLRGITCICRIINGENQSLH